MCNSLAQGGQRCSHHAKGVLERKAVALREAAEKATNPSDVTAFHAAQAEWEQAAVEYASTPAGKTALTERMQAAGEQGDPRTEALLTNIIQRGDQLREVNAQMKAVLAAAAITETGLPDERPAYEFAEDQNNNPLSEEDRAHWMKLMDSLDANHVSSLSKPTGDKSTGYYVGQATEAIKRAKNLDAVVADAASTDEELYDSIYQLRVRVSDMGTTRDVWPAALRAQTRRAMNHPNAGKNTFSHASGVVGASEVVMHPNCPPNVAYSKLVDGEGTRLNDDQWQVIEERSLTSPLLTTAVAKGHPNEGNRDEAVIRLMGTQWDTVSASDAQIIQREIPNLPMTDSQRELLELSLVRWAQQYGEEHDRRNIEYKAQFSASNSVRALVGAEPVAEPQPAPTGRKSFWA